MLVCPGCGEENPERARFCLGCAAPLAVSAPAPERRKLATLLFCDMSGSTAMGERVDAESVREMMFSYFHQMRDAIERHGGTVEKFVGDAVMAVFGIPALHEDDALRACRAAWEMQKRLSELNVELERRFGSAIALRIGVNTGEVVAGDAASHETMVTGDAVNVAARLEQTAQPGEILLGQLTYRLVRDAVTVEAVKPLTLKGKSEPLSAYRLLDVLAAVPPSRRLEAPLVGRETELRILEEAFREALDTRSGRLVTVVGEAGVGKSRLAVELVARAPAESTVLRGRCLAYGEGITFWPIGEIVRQAAGVRDEHDRETARTRVLALVAGEAQGAVIGGRVAQAIGLAEGSAPAEEIGWAIRKLLEVLASRGPLLVVVDDLHSAEPVLLDLIASLPDLIRHVPILCLCLARPEIVETRPDWKVSIRLEPLGQRDARELVERLLRRQGLSSDLDERIQRAAGGNPLFAEELVALMAEEDGGSMELPATLSALLGARLDRLDASVRGTLERAAIEGEVFHRGALMALSRPDARTNLVDNIEVLVAKEVVRPAQSHFTDEAAFGFRHILIRDAAYNATTKKLRAELHERFADWLADVTAGRITEYEEILGYHLEQAYRYQAELGPLHERGRDLGDRAAGFLASAGRRALRRYDLSAAANLFGRAAGLLPDRSRERLSLLPELARVAIECGDFVEAHELLAEAMELAQTVEDRRVGAHARLLRLQLDLQKGSAAGVTNASQVVKIAEREIPSLEHLGDYRILSLAWRLIGAAHWVLGRSGEMKIAFERALALARQSGDSAERADILSWIVQPLWAGRTPVADGIKRSREILQEAKGELRVEASVVAVLALLLAEHGRFEEARHLSARSKLIYEELRMPLAAAWESYVPAEIELLANEPAAAERELQATFATLTAMGEQGVLSSVTALLAETLYRQGRWDEAEQVSRISEHAAAPDDIYSQARWRATRAKVLARRQQLEVAEGLARAGVAMLAETDWLPARGEALLDLAEVLRLASRPREAAHFVEEALTLFEEKDLVVRSMRARSILVELAPPK